MDGRAPMPSWYGRRGYSIMERGAALRAMYSIGETQSARYRVCMQCSARHPFFTHDMLFVLQGEFMDWFMKRYRIYVRNFQTYPFILPFLNIMLGS